MFVQIEKAMAGDWFNAVFDEPRQSNLIVFSTSGKNYSSIYLTKPVTQHHLWFDVGEMHPTLYTYI
jgi:hypothetical protein